MSLTDQNGIIILYGLVKILWYGQYYSWCQYLEMMLHWLEFLNTYWFIATSNLESKNELGMLQKLDDKFSENGSYLLLTHGTLWDFLAGLFFKIRLFKNYLILLYTELFFRKTIDLKGFWRQGHSKPKSNLVIRCILENCSKSFKRVVVVDCKNEWIEMEWDQLN